jgi:CRISPR-associated protein Cmr1
MKAPQSLPQLRLKSARGGRTLSEISVRLELVTPILGGSFQTRMADDIDVIRAATARGHLRFWWRSLHGHEFGISADLHAAESALWGRAATDEGGRSAVEIRVEVVQGDTIDSSDIRLYDSGDGQATRGAYALWPARAEKEKGRIKTPPAPRRTPGTRLRLTLIAPEDREGEIRNVVRAWILFGGYGARTRRGLGTLKVVDGVNAWLPRGATREAFAALFGRDVFAPPGKPAIDVPWLAGASLHVGGAVADAGQAWTTALDWLKEFRQGTSGAPGDRAREPGTKPQPQRPSISNWPEADKIRHLRGKTTAHPPRHNATPAWPRAGFGLPIAGQFQKNARNGDRLDEPDSFELRWRSASGEHDRLASPLIVKALPLADGTFVACALWLNRAYPTGEVILRGASNSAAPFDRLIAPGDTARFSAPAGKSTLRAAFLDWLRARHGTTVAAP